jgi:hypothetical protein
MDPATKRFRPAEAETAIRIELERGVTLTRAPEGHSCDWLDEAGKSYDAVGNFPPQFFDRTSNGLASQNRSSSICTRLTTYRSMCRSSRLNR